MKKNSLTALSCPYGPKLKILLYYFVISGRKSPELKSPDWKNPEMTIPCLKSSKFKSQDLKKFGDEKSGPDNEICEIENKKSGIKNSLVQIF